MGTITHSFLVDYPTSDDQFKAFIADCLTPPTVFADDMENMLTNDLRSLKVSIFTISEITTN